MDAGVGGKSRRGPARPEPLASLSKYINTSKNAMWQVKHLPRYLLLYVILASTFLDHGMSHNYH
jgi:hypothetical protein